MKQELVRLINQRGTSEVHKITRIPMRNLQYWKRGEKLPAAHYCYVICQMIKNFYGGMAA